TARPRSSLPTVSRSASCARLTSASSWHYHKAWPLLRLPRRRKCSAMEREQSPGSAASDPRFACPDRLPVGRDRQLKEASNGQDLRRTPAAPGEVFDRSAGIPGLRPCGAGRPACATRPQEAGDPPPAPRPSAAKASRRDGRLIEASIVAASQSERNTT